MTRRTEPRACAAADIATPHVLAGHGERFSGYGVMGLPFRSGHYLALRHFPSSSIGPGYRAVWHRDPGGRWTVFADVPPAVSCARFLGAALTETRTTPIRISWTGPRSLAVELSGVLGWSMEIAASVGTRLMSAIGATLPGGAAREPWLLRSMGVAARPVLGVGAIRLYGTMPNGQTFGAVPRRIWRIGDAYAELDGHDLGVPGPLPEQEHLGDFMLPQKGVFFAHAVAVFTSGKTAEVSR